MEKRGEGRYDNRIESSDCLKILGVATGKAVEKTMENQILKAFHSKFRKKIGVLVCRLFSIPRYGTRFAR